MGCADGVKALELLQVSAEASFSSLACAAKREWAVNRPNLVQPLSNLSTLSLQPIHSISRKRPHKSRNAASEEKRGAEPSKKKARMKEAVSSHETRTDSDDSRSSGTTTKTG